MLNEKIERFCADLSAAVNKYNEKHGIEKQCTPDDIIFDDSRAWSLSISGDFLNLSCRRFGAYRNYLGGGVRGEMDHNGRDQEGTTALGNLFASALREIENAYNEDLSPDACESWEKATGVLL